MIFITNTKLYPLHLVLREMVINITTMLNSQVNEQMLRRRAVYAGSIKAAIIAVTAFPILLVYPFLQKHFTKGIMLGSIKG
jgi:putative aldouronate transport system permease protein